MNDGIKKYLINENIKLIDAMKILSKIGSKILFVVDGTKLKGALTDGDIRRYLVDNGDLNQIVNKIANYNPKYLVNASHREAQIFMREKIIDAIPIVDNDKNIIDIVFFNDNILTKDYDKINLPVVMMAGGKGTRLYPFTKVLPKPLIPIDEVPVAERIINQFIKFGCMNHYMIVNHMKNMIKSYFNEIDKNYNLTFIDEEIPLGTGGGLYYIKGLINKTFILTNCDIMIKHDFSKIVDFHNKNKNIITMIVASQKMKVPYGVVEFDNDGITSMKEKPEINYFTNTGCYIVEPKVLQDLKGKENIGFPDIINKYIKSCMSVKAYPILEDEWIDIGEIDKLNNANSFRY